MDHYVYQNFFFNIYEVNFQFFYNFIMLESKMHKDFQQSHNREDIQNKN